MNWEALGAIGEVLGSVMIIATLFYLANQIRHSERATSAEMKLRIIEEVNQQNRDVYLNPELAELIAAWRKPEVTLDSMDPAAQVRTTRFVVSHLNRIRGIFDLHQQGIVDDQVMRVSVDAALEGLRQTNVYREVWQRVRSSQPKEYQEHVDAIFSNVKGDA